MSKKQNLKRITSKMHCNRRNIKKNIKCFFKKIQAYLYKSSIWTMRNIRYSKIETIKTKSHNRTTAFTNNRNTAFTTYLITTPTSKSQVETQPMKCHSAHITVLIWGTASRFCKLEKAKIKWIRALAINFTREQSY